MKHYYRIEAKFLVEAPDGVQSLHAQRFTMTMDCGANSLNVILSNGVDIAFAGEADRQRVAPYLSRVKGIKSCSIVLEDLGPIEWSGGKKPLKGHKVGKGKS